MKAQSSRAMATRILLRTSLAAKRTKREWTRFCAFQFLECGDLARGFARIRCDHCKEDRRLAFSSKGRWFCRPATRRRSSSSPQPGKARV